MLGGVGRIDRGYTPLVRYVLSFVMCSCATVDIPDAGLDAGPVDGLVGGGLDATPTVADAARAEMGTPPVTCAPGARVGLCAVCGPDGTPVAAADDPECPPVDCSGRDGYERRDQGEVKVCVRLSYETAAGTCEGAGVCRTVNSPGACLGPTITEAARVEGECQTIGGCAAAAGPTEAPEPSGTPCGGGECDGVGTCEAIIVDGCEAFEGYTVCEGGLNPPYCDVDVVPPDGGHCGQACLEAANTRCLAAWRADEAPCAHGPEAGCLEVAPRLICRCAKP